MKCPKCGGKLLQIMFRDVEVDRCRVCKGIWFDFAELQDLQDMVASELVDTGNEVVGREMDELRRVTCPKCESKIITLTDNEQRHISYEVCPKCFGCFLDAGEFTDLKEFTLPERIKQWVNESSAKAGQHGSAD